MESMKLLWVVIGVCSCWLACLIQPQQCTELSKETTETVAASVNNVSDNLHFTSFLSSVVSHVGGKTSEPKVQITGFNGLCVTVPKGDYHNGNGIVVDECKDGQENQLWTLKRDQTLRSRRKCMTTYGYRSGDYIMIYDCWAVANAATKWQIQSDSRRIVNPRSGLFLTAQRGSNGVYKLAVDYNDYVPRQAWVLTNNTKPRVTKILGLHSLCLTLDGVQRVEMAECGQNVAEQRWAVYLDGTIRPELHQDRCLRFEYGEYVVGVGTCGGSANEPWAFQDNGTLLHLATGKVMDIKATPGRPSRFSPFLNCYHQSASQIWSMTAP